MSFLLWNDLCKTSAATAVEAVAMAVVMSTSVRQQKVAAHANWGLGGGRSSSHIDSPHPSCWPPLHLPEEWKGLCPRGQAGWYKWHRLRHSKAMMGGNYSKVELFWVVLVRRRERRCIIQRHSKNPPLRKVWIPIELCAIFFTDK